MRATDPSSEPSVESLLHRAVGLERELDELERRLSHLDAQEPRAGLHLIVEAGSHAALLDARAVLQIARLLEFTPIAGAPPAVLGSFVRRGEPGVAIDLARVLGSDREPDLDAHLVIVGGARTLGILVDRVRGVVDGPARVGARAARLLPAFRSDLVAGWCEAGGSLLPLLGLAALERVAAERSAGEAPRPAGDGGCT